MELTRRDRLADADRRLSGHLAEAARHWWGIGSVCLEVDREELHAEGGFADVYAWAEERHGIARRTVVRAMDVARHFNAEMAERYGSQKLAATVSYLEATRRIEEAGEVTALRFKVRREGRFRAIPFEEASYRDIDEARQLVVRARKEPAPVPKEMRTRRGERRFRFAEGGLVVGGRVLSQTERSATLALDEVSWHGLGLCEPGVYGVPLASRTAGVEGWEQALAPGECSYEPSNE